MPSFSKICPSNSSNVLLYLHFCVQWEALLLRCWNLSWMLMSWSSWDAPKQRISSLKLTDPLISASVWCTVSWKISFADLTQNDRCLYLYNPRCVAKVVMHLDSSANSSSLYPWLRYGLLKFFTPDWVCQVLHFVPFLWCFPSYSSDHMSTLFLVFC